MGRTYSLVCCREYGLGNNDEVNGGSGPCFAKMARMAAKMLDFLPKGFLRPGVAWQSLDVCTDTVILYQSCHPRSAVYFYYLNKTNPMK